mmetsp:Transcript_56479/g.123771  ORF Transcript_56479/g.123771 Transcript_56479/m.123771 type:complete len:590 (+) Transcript_56479:33-1802(+)
MAQLGGTYEAVKPPLWRVLKNDLIHLVALRHLLEHRFGTVKAAFRRFKVGRHRGGLTLNELDSGLRQAGYFDGPVLFGKRSVEPQSSLKLFKLLNVDAVDLSKFRLTEGVFLFIVHLHCASAADQIIWAAFGQENSMILADHDRGRHADQLWAVVSAVTVNDKCRESIPPAFLAFIIATAISVCRIEKMVVRLFDMIGLFCRLLLIYPIEETVVQACFKAIASAHVAFPARESRIAKSIWRTMTIFMALKPVEAGTEVFSKAVELMDRLQVSERASGVMGSDGGSRFKTMLSKLRSLEDRFASSEDMFVGLSDAAAMLNGERRFYLALATRGYWKRLMVHRTRFPVNHPAVKVIEAICQHMEEDIARAMPEVTMNFSEPILKTLSRMASFPAEIELVVPATKAVVATKISHLQAQIVSLPGKSSVVPTPIDAEWSPPPSPERRRGDSVSLAKPSPRRRRPASAGQVAQELYVEPTIPIKQDWLQGNPASILTQLVLQASDPTSTQLFEARLRAQNQEGGQQKAHPVPSVSEQLPLHQKYFLRVHNLQGQRPVAARAPQCPGSGHSSRSRSASPATVSSFLKSDAWLHNA